MMDLRVAGIDRTPTPNDLEIANLVHRALAAIRGTGRFGDRKVFIASLWAMVLHIEAETRGTLPYGATLEQFKAWLLRGLRLTRDGTEKGALLVVLARADFVAAMDPTMVAASETVTDGATFHFVLDPRGGPQRVRAPDAIAQAVHPNHARKGRCIAASGLITSRWSMCSEPR